MRVEELEKDVVLRVEIVGYPQFRPCGPLPDACVIRPSRCFVVRYSSKSPYRKSV
jgi:hypothetical protein